MKERAPKVSQGTPKVSQKGPKGSQKGTKSEPAGAKSEPKVNKIRHKINIKVRFFDRPPQEGLAPFWEPFSTKNDEKINAKIEAEKVMKFHENSMRK